MVKENKKRSTNTRVKKKEHSIAYFDYSLLAILICLICFGLVMLYSTSSYSAMMKQNGDSLFYFKRQVLFCIVGLIGMWIVSRIDYHWYFERSKFFYFISIFILAQQFFLLCERCQSLENGYEVPTVKEKKAYLLEKKMTKEGLLKVMSLAKTDRQAGKQVLIVNMKKNKKFQKEQLAEDGYIEIVDCYADSVENL